MVDRLALHGVRLRRVRPALRGQPAQRHHGAVDQVGPGQVDTSEEIEKDLHVTRQVLEVLLRETGSLGVRATTLRRWLPPVEHDLLQPPVQMRCSSTTMCAR